MAGTEPRSPRFALAALTLAVRAIWRVLPTLALIVVLNFTLLKLAPGDAADVLAGESGAATAETMANIRERLGLDLPVLEQFVSYVTGLAKLDFGTSSRFSAPVLEVIMSRLPNTILLMVCALGFALIVGIVAGTAMAVRVGSLWDRILSVLVLAFYSIPSFWGALMLIVLLSVKLGWLPSGGSQTIGFEGGSFARMLDNARYMVLPALSLSLFFIAVYARLTRAAMLDVMHQDYVRTARAKGLAPTYIMVLHVLRNALIPVTTMAGVHFGILLGGAIVTETVFAWPGLGSLALQAVFGRDFQLLLGILLLSSLLVIAVNILTDLLHAWLDPRIQAG